MEDPLEERAHPGDKEGERERKIRSVRNHHRQLHPYSVIHTHAEAERGREITRLTQREDGRKGKTGARVPHLNLACCAWIRGGCAAHDSRPQDGGTTGKGEWEGEME